jgi:hypothetical protein
MNLNSFMHGGAATLVLAYTVWLLLVDWKKKEYFSFVVTLVIGGIVTFMLAGKDVYTPVIQLINILLSPLGIKIPV